MEGLVAGRDHRVIMRSAAAGRVWSRISIAGRQATEKPSLRSRAALAFASLRSRKQGDSWESAAFAERDADRGVSPSSVAWAQQYAVSLLGAARAKLPAAACRSPPQAIYAVAANGRALPAADGTHVLDKALETPDLIAARAAAALDFRDDINGLRALAVLGVVVFHADRAWLPGGFVGVDIFFVISGFLISRIILSQCAAGRFSLAMFYARRAKRILPALLVVVSFVWIVGWFMAAPTQFREIGGGLLGNSYFTVNFWLLRLAGVGGYFGADATVKPLLHLWSLSIEEQFYLVWSVLLLALFKLERRLVFIVILGAVRRLVRVQRFLTPIDPIAAFYLPWTRGWELALGALLAYREVFWLEAPPLSVATPRQYRRWTRNRADARRLPVPERGAVLSRLARGDPDTWLRAGHRQSAFASGRGRARQSRRRFLRRDLLSALFVALAAVRLRPHLAWRHPDRARSARAGVRGRRSRRAHLPAGRAAGRDSVSPPALRDGVGPRGLARADRIGWQADLRREGLSVPLSAARGPHFRL